jgi:VWFA-related protein
MVRFRATRSITAAAFAAAAVLAAVTVVVHSQDRQPPQQQPPPTPFRSGTNIVRVDVTVIDRSGRPVSSLLADDFEVREDGAVQPVTSFKFLSNTGEPSDDRSLPIRSQQHAAAEAARDDVRVFLVFWDEYHIGQFDSALRARAALSQIMLSSFGPTDLVAIMDPLTPSNAIEFTRDRRALADRIQRLEGRAGVYLPPRSIVEEALLEAVNWRVEAVEPLRAQVTTTAIKAAAAHLGTLREGRKTMILVTEGLLPIVGGRGMGAGAAPRGNPSLDGYLDDQNTALDIVRTANDSNTAVHIIDPRGLQVAGGYASMLETLASGTGGELHHSNDMKDAVQRIVAQASATYLLGYTKDVPQDGRFHEIKVRVKRGGYDVRARAGYWAPRAADVERARTAAAAAVLPPAMAAAFASLTAPGSSRLAEIWVGRWPVADGRSLITVGWTPLTNLPPETTPAAVSVRLTSGDEPPIEQNIQPGGTRFEVGDAAAQLAIRVLDKSGEILDRETRSVEPIDAAKAPLGLATVVHLARNPAEARAFADAEPPIHAGREFVRTDRLLIRIRASGPSAAGAELTGRLIDRRGSLLVPLPIAGGAGGWYRLDLPLASIAPGDFAVAIDAHNGNDRAEAFVPIRVRR